MFSFILSLKTFYMALSEYCHVCFLLSPPFGWAIPSLFISRFHVSWGAIRTHIWVVICLHVAYHVVLRLISRGCYLQMDRSRVKGCFLMQTGQFVYILRRYVWFSFFLSFLVCEKSNKSKFTEEGNCKFMHNYANTRQSEGERNLFSPRLRLCSKLCAFFLLVEYIWVVLKMFTAFVGLKLITSQGEVRSPRLLQYLFLFPIWLFSTRLMFAHLQCACHSAIEE